MNIIETIRDRKPPMRTDSDFVYLYHVKELIKERTAPLLTIPREELLRYMEGTEYKDYSNFRERCRQWAQGIIGDFYLSMLAKLGISLEEIRACIALDHEESRTAVSLPFSASTCRIQLNACANEYRIAIPGPGTGDDALSWVQGSISPWADAYIELNSRTYYIHRNECTIVRHEPYVKITKTSVLFRQKEHRSPITGIRARALPYVLSDAEFIFMNIDILLNGLDAIIAEPRYKNTVLGFASAGLAYFGGVPVTLGLLAELWREGLSETCPYCGGRAYIHSAGASPLSGSNVFRAFCPACRTPVIGSSARGASLARAFVNRYRSSGYGRSTDGIDIDSIIIELAQAQKTAVCGGRGYVIASSEEHEAQFGMSLKKGGPVIALDTVTA
ncbi:MAG: hypothetical protein AABZ39_00265 [Spirochaetota bacterium]